MSTKGLKFSVSAVLCALFAALLALPALASPHYPIHVDLQVRTKKAGVNANGYIDSLATYFIGDASSGAAPVDTFVTFETRVQGVSWWDIADAPSTAYGQAKLVLYGDNAIVGANWDTTFVAVDGCMDAAGSICQTGSFVGYLTTTADKAVGIPLLVDGDASKDPYLFPYWRIRRRADGSSAALWTLVKAKVIFPAWNK